MLCCSEAPLVRVSSGESKGTCEGWDPESFRQSHVPPAVELETQLCGFGIRSWHRKFCLQSWTETGGVLAAPPHVQALWQFPPQTAASPDEQKVFALWESGDMSDQVSDHICCCFPIGGETREQRGVLSQSQWVQWLQSHSLYFLEEGACS